MHGQPVSSAAAAATSADSLLSLAFKSQLGAAASFVGFCVSVRDSVDGGGFFGVDPASVFLAVAWIFVLASAIGDILKDDDEDDDCWQLERPVHLLLSALLSLTAAQVYAQGRWRMMQGYGEYWYDQWIRVAGAAAMLSLLITVLYVNWNQYMSLREELTENDEDDDDDTDDELPEKSSISMP